MYFKGFSGALPNENLLRKCAFTKKCKNYEDSYSPVQACLNIISHTAKTCKCLDKVIDVYQGWTQAFPKSTPNNFLLYEPTRMY